MYTFLLVTTILVFALLLITTAMQPIGSKLSIFELKRRAVLGDKNAKAILDREYSLVDVLSLQRSLVALLLVIIVLLSVYNFGWLIGILIAVFVAFEHGAIASLKPVRKISQKIYKRFELNIFNFVQKNPYLFKFLRSLPTGNDSADSWQIGSRDELQHLINESNGIITNDEKKLIIHSLSFNNQLVSTVMTPRSMIDSIKKSEYLGPLTLDELHKLGHSRLPVIDGDIDHIVGILNLRSLLALDVKRSSTADKAMDSKVYYIREDQTLHHALAAFLRTRHQLFVVINEFRETVGLLSLEDVLETLLGRKIIDEFDAHDDLRSVALRNPRSNNHPDKREDV